MIKGSVDIVKIDYFLYICSIFSYSEYITNKVGGLLKTTS